MLRAFSIGIVFAAVVHSGVPAEIRGALSDYYRRPHYEIAALEERRVPPDEMPVVLFIADKGGAEPLDVWEFRRSGLGWARIAARYRLNADVFYVPITADPGPPYAHSYNHYRKHPRNEWHKIRLDDDDIVTLVNLRFYSENYGLPADRMVHWRRGDEPFYKVIEVAAKEHWKAPDERGQIAGNNDRR